MLALGSYAAVGPPVIEAVMVAVHPQYTKSRCRSDGFAHYARLRPWAIACRPPWDGSWNGPPDNPSAASAVTAMTCAVGAAGVHGVMGRIPCKRQVSGSNPLTGSQVTEGKCPLCVSACGTNVARRSCPPAFRQWSRTVAAALAAERPENTVIAARREVC
jgi:hypothetical protein